MNFALETMENKFTVSHNQVQIKHLPYMPFPPKWPTSIPKDKLAGWFEAYVERMEIDFWTGAAFAGARYDDKAGVGTSTCNARRAGPAP